MSDTLKTAYLSRTADQRQRFFALKNRFWKVVRTASMMLFTLYLNSMLFFFLHKMWVPVRTVPESMFCSETLILDTRMNRLETVLVCVQNLCFDNRLWLLVRTVPKIYVLSK